MHHLRWDAGFGLGQVTLGLARWAITESGMSVLSGADLHELMLHGTKSAERDVDTFLGLPSASVGLLLRTNSSRCCRRLLDRRVCLHGASRPRRALAPPLRGKEQSRSQCVASHQRREWPCYARGRDCLRSFVSNRRRCGERVRRQKAERG
jgi:hypothetical protein